MFTQRVIILSGMGFWCVAKQIGPRSGVANPYNDALRGVGYHDRYWSDAAYSDINTAYFIDVSSLDVTPAHYSVRWNGFSVRCIAS